MIMLTKSSVGRKILMAVTGLILVCFILVHMLGNTSIFVGPDGINAYAKHLHDLGPLVWIFRLAMLVAFCVHIALGIQLTLENRAGRPQAYAVKQDLRATFASKNMIVSGVALLLFVIYHLLHFTMHVTNPEISAGVGANFDALNRPDVFKMVTLSFKQGVIALIYVVAMVFLLLHLIHGVGSFFQSLGLTNDRTITGVGSFGKAVGIILFLGYVSIPVFIIIGVVG